VIVADDAALPREGLRRLLVEARFEVVGTASDLDELLHLVDAVRPDVAMVDIRMPPTNTDEGLRVARQIRARHRDIGVLVLSQHVRVTHALELLAGGARTITAGSSPPSPTSAPDRVGRAVRDLARAAQRFRRPPAGFPVDPRRPRGGGSAGSLGRVPAVEGEGALGRVPTARLAVGSAGFLPVCRSSRGSGSASGEDQKNANDQM
jgi:CheY-like chemotaxis protein